MSDLNIFQQVICLSFKVCSAATEIGDTQYLEGVLADNLNTLLGNSAFAGSDSWEIVWGPQVWQAPGSQVADQALAVTCMTGTNGAKTYVVSIAATNPRSAFDVLYEDFGAEPAYLQNIPGLTGGQMSAGNWTGLQILLGMTDNSTKATLQQFLASVGSGATLVFAGHSLGGGLTPLLAYSLYPNGAATSGSQWSAIYTYPTAGPTTANQAFATAFDAAYPVTTGSGYQTWNANQYNAHDVVPNAWSNAQNAPSLTFITASNNASSSAMFYTTALYGLTVATLRSTAQLVVTSNGSVPYIATNNNALFTGPRDVDQISSNTQLEQEILYQHIQAYIVEFGIGAFFDSSVTQTIQPPLLGLVRRLSTSTEATTAEQLEPA